MKRDDALQNSEKAQKGKAGCRRYWLWVVVILVLLVVAYLLWWGLLRPEPAVDCVTVNKDLVGIAQPVPGERPYLVNDQVVVTGQGSLRDGSRVLASLPAHAPITG